MVFINSLKNFLIGGWILASLVIQPSFGMNDEPADEKGKALTVFFRASGVELPDEVTLEIFHQINKDKAIIKDFCSLTLTCHKGYRLVGKPLSEILKEAYFDHLPEKYLASVIEDKKLPPLTQMHSIFQKLYTYQLQEIEQLKTILSPGYEPQEIYSSAKPSLIQLLSNDIKQQIWKDYCKADEEENTCQKTSVISNTIQKWVFQENLLNKAHHSLMIGLSSALRTSPLVVDPNCTSFSLRGAITRLSPDVITMIYGAITQFNNILKESCPEELGNTYISLACNNLRWLPDELFSTPLLNQHLTLDIRNNLLTYLPDSIENFKESLTNLHVGNIVAADPNSLLYRNYGMSHRSGAGNLFKTIPLPILKLTNLKILDCRSLGLEEFPCKTIFEDLPSLSALRLDHNKLRVIPTALKDHNIQITSVGNPAYGLITFDGPTLCYCYDNYVLPLVKFYNHYVDPLIFPRALSVSVGEFTFGVGVLGGSFGIKSEASAEKQVSH